MKICQHHRKYLELDGYDEIEIISVSEHRRIKPRYISHNIIRRAHSRSPVSHNYQKKYKKDVEFTFSDSYPLGNYFNCYERIKFNINTNHIQVQTGFQWTKH